MLAQVKPYKFSSVLAFCRKSSGYICTPLFSLPHQECTKVWKKLFRAFLETNKVGSCAGVQCYMQVLNESAERSYFFPHLMKSNLVLCFCLQNSFKMLICTSKIDIINNKARYNGIDAKYQRMAFRSVPTNPYLEFLVKQKWCKFRRLCLYSMSVQFRW